MCGGMCVGGGTCVWGGGEVVCVGYVVLCLVCRICKPIP